VDKEVGDPILEVRNLRVHIGTPRGVVRAVDDVSLTIGHAQALGVVGESGSGKSVTAKAVMGMLPRGSGCSGQILFRGRDLLTLSPSERRKIWGTQVAMVLQDPGRSLNPVVRVERQLTEGMRGDILAQFEKALRNRFPVTVRRQELDRLL